MNSIKISTTWLTSKPIELCFFAKLIADNDRNGVNQNKTGNKIKDILKSFVDLNFNCNLESCNESEDCNHDIESLLQSYENCVKMIEPNEETSDCKIIIKSNQDINDKFETEIDSFSMLCSAKVIEIHANDSNEYLKTLFNE